MTILVAFAISGVVAQKLLAASANNFKIEYITENFNFRELGKLEQFSLVGFSQMYGLFTVQSEFDHFPDNVR